MQENEKRERENGKIEKERESLCEKNWVLFEWEREKKRKGKRERARRGREIWGHLSDYKCYRQTSREPCLRRLFGTGHFSRENSLIGYFCLFLSPVKKKARKEEKNMFFYLFLFVSQWHLRKVNGKGSDLIQNLLKFEQKNVQKLWHFCIWSLNTFCRICEFSNDGLKYCDK